MQSEEKKYLDALKKTYELKKAFDDLSPESRKRLFKEILEAAGLSQLYIEFQRFMQDNR